MAKVDRAAQRLGLIAAAGELAAALELVPWQIGEAREAAAGMLAQWIDRRGGTEPAEVRQAIEQVRLFIETGMAKADLRLWTMPMREALTIWSGGPNRATSAPGSAWLPGAGAVRRYSARKRSV